MTLSGMLSERALETPRKTCIKFGKRRFSYSEIDGLVSLTAGGLRELGLNVNDRIAILMDNCPEYVISYFAGIRASGIVVPINTFLTSGEIAYVLRDSRCRMLICGANFKTVVDEIMHDLPDIKAVTFSEIPQKEIKPHSGNETDVAVLLYTSGTTGFPKGAMLTHLNLRSNVEACGKTMRVSHRDRILLFLPLFHSFSFTVCVLLPVYAGASIILLESVKPFSRVISSILWDRITMFVGVPTIFSILARKKIPIYLRYLFRYLTNIRACISGASALPLETLHNFEKKFRRPLIEGYGLTEASPVVAVNPIDGIRKPNSVGPPLPGVEIDIIGSDGRSLARGEVGELLVRGRNVMKGYFNKEKETGEVLKNGWLYTGDMARIDEDGYIYIVDRKKDVIIIDGMNIYPREVEDSVINHPSVKECAMVGIPDKRGSEVSILFIKKHDGSELSDEEIRDHLKSRVARFKMPRRVVFLGELPKTATGKIMKGELKKLQVIKLLGY